ncbi:MAG: hypothetical protein GQ540_03820 [Lutibacter sp.]|uniref:hypothetical protein n=1 Tax=Lutibacter sp. TaxID=1925666 RepID=UPI0019F6C0AA|nr:hypothetical protein [Lutibacter sp.]NOR27641.1 hypothetical protein [Lutibacter sp.]
MTDFKYIKTQEDLLNLMKKTNFLEDDSFDGLEIQDYDKEEDYQFIWTPECSCMGTLMSQDMEGNGEDALFVQTLVQMFISGKLKVIK